RSPASSTVPAGIITGLSCPEGAKAEYIALSSLVGTVILLSSGVATVVGTGRFIWMPSLAIMTGYVDESRVQLRTGAHQSGNSCRSAIVCGAGPVGSRSGSRIFPGAAALSEGLGAGSRQLL